MSTNTSIDLNLPVVPSVTDPDVFEELLRIYNAIRSLALGLDDYTQGGEGLVDIQISSAIELAQLLNLKKDIQALSESLIPEVINWAQPGAIGSVNPNTGAFTTLSATDASTLADTTTAKFGANGKAAASAVVLPAAATDPATTQALANAMRTLLINFGLGA